MGMGFAPTCSASSGEPPVLHKTTLTTALQRLSPGGTTCCFLHANLKFRHCLIAVWSTLIIISIIILFVPRKLTSNLTLGEQ